MRLPLGGRPGFRLRSLPAVEGPAQPVSTANGAEARSRYTEVDSLLRRNEHMLVAEQFHLAQRLADSEAAGDSYWDLLLYEIFGYQSKRRRQQATVFRRRRVRLIRLELLISRASAALEGGNVELAQRILLHTSPQLGILTDDVVAASIADIPVLGDPETVTACPRAS